MKKNYEKKDPIDHILLRPDMYVGSTTLKEKDEYVCEQVNGVFKIVNRKIQTSAAILRIFVEILSNAVDNVSEKCSAIKVDIDKVSGLTSVWNDGEHIPIEMNEKEKMYNHTLIFGNLLTGSNYDDTIDRTVSGKNGVGAKVCNVFSLMFQVEGYDPEHKKYFQQIWRNNMKEASPAKVEDEKKGDGGGGYTKVSYIPDFARFGLKGYTDDLIALYTKYIIDAAMLTKKKVYLNGELLQITSLLDYSKLYEKEKEGEEEEEEDEEETKKKKEEVLIVKTASSEVILTVSDTGEHECISFVNGICTKLGGVHVDVWSEVLFRPLIDKLNTKKDKPQINIKEMKQFFRMIINCVLPNPEFSSQEKEKLENPKPQDAKVKASELNKINKWSVMSDIEDILKSKEMLVLKKSEKKKKGYVKIEGYDPANLSGTKKSSECCLILCEGLSAKTYAVAGIQKGVYDKKGRDYMGVLSLTGKCLNVRNSNATTIAKNKVITNLIQALGLQYNMDYKDEKNYESLNYGRVILLTDSDVDGIHISGLIMNFFHNLFPTLLDRDPPFLVSMQTPIVRVFQKGGDLLFYDENRFKAYASQSTKNFKSKYYKGLGTTKSEDVPDTFGEKMVEYITDDKVSVTINKVFHKNHTDDRKKWIEAYDPVNCMSLDDCGKVTKMNMSEFLNNEVVKFSLNDCGRSIPNLFDGFKESQRKVFYAMKKKNLTFNKQSLKVAQLGGYVAEHTNYHHGEQNLFETIIKMASEYPGSNNIPLLYRDGQFATRLNNEDAASPRYIYTKFESITPYIFRDEDDILLDYVEDDGEVVEPKFYVPIIPMILVNGCTGIGTGWSCNVPCFNPLDLIESIKVWLENDGEIMTFDEDGSILTSLLPEIMPWYRGFEGTIKKHADNNRFITEGIIETMAENSKKKKNKENKVVVKELPIGLWTDKFKDMCEDLLADKKIKSLSNYSTQKKVNFIVTEADDGINLNLNTLKLHSTLSTSNMVLFNEKNQLKKYTLDEIINDFCVLRYQLYVKRKEKILEVLGANFKHISNKVRFIMEIIEEKFDIMNVSEADIIKKLVSDGYDREVKDATKEDDTAAAGGETNGSKGYEYLLRLNVRNFTSEKVENLKKELVAIQEHLEEIEKTDAKTMWLNDLRDFEGEYSKWLATISK
jgi:DNA topoisomerase-2